MSSLSIPNREVTSINSFVYVAQTVAPSQEIFKELLLELHRKTPQYQKDLTDFFNAKAVVLRECISNELILDASKAMTTAYFAFEKEGIHATFRPQKQLSRVNTKYEEECQSQKMSKPCNFFRVISDIAAARIPCTLKEIDGMVAQIQKLAEGKDGWCVIKGATKENPNGNFKTGNSPKDIIQYIYLYLPEVGQVLEIQIGSQFAMDKFAVDSACREKQMADTDGEKGFRKELYKLSQKLLEGGNHSMGEREFDQAIAEMREAHQPKEQRSLELILTLNKELCRQPNIPSSAKFV